MLRAKTIAAAVLFLGLLGPACSSPSTDGSAGGGGVGSGSGGSSSSGGGSSSSGGASSSGGSSSGGDAGGPPANAGFPGKWIDGTACATEPKVQVWKYDDATYVLRQSLCTNFEGPFVYLLLGSTKAILVDTGTGAVDLATEVGKLVGARDLVVAHSHGHGDHVGGDGQFAGKPKTTVVGTSAGAVRSFFQIQGEAAAAYDLGGRVLDLMMIPGHQAAHVAVYDRATRILLTGDTLYPGRLYIDDFASYRASVGRLVAFVDAGHPVSWVLGGHVELTAAGNGADFAQGSKAHPNEHVLQLTTAELRDLDAVVRPMTTPARTVRPHFILSP